MARIKIEDLPEDEVFGHILAPLSASVSPIGPPKLLPTLGQPTLGPPGGFSPISAIRG